MPQQALGAPPIDALRIEVEDLTLLALADALRVTLWTRVRDQEYGRLCVFELVGRGSDLLAEAVADLSRIWLHGTPQEVCSAALHWQRAGRALAREH